MFDLLEEQQLIRTTLIPSRLYKMLEGYYRDKEKGIINNYAFEELKDCCLAQLERCSAVQRAVDDKTRAREES